MKRIAASAVCVSMALLAACSRGPGEAELRKQVQENLDKSFKPGLLELAALKRQGSSPLPAAENGALVLLCAA